MEFVSFSEMIFAELRRRIREMAAAFGFGF